MLEVWETAIFDKTYDNSKRLLQLSMLVVYLQLVGARTDEQQVEKRTTIEEIVHLTANSFSSFFTQGVWRSNSDTVRQI